ncbi:hypothetical protein V6N13_111385 [Hibiscus sabdariffa]
MSEAQPKLSNAEAERGLHEKERVKNLSVLRQQLEMKNTALTEAQRDIAEECERTAVLSKRVETLEQLDDKHQLIQKEFNGCKEMLEESSWCQLQLKEQCLQVDNDSKEKIGEVCEALNVTNSNLAEEREKVASLLRRVESLNLIERQWVITQKELESYKRRLEEASRRQTHLEEQTLQMENESREKLKEVCEDLDKTKSELTEEQERTASLIKRVESLDHIEDQWLLTQKELEKYKEMLEEASMKTANLELVEERERTTSLMKRLESSHHLEEQCVPRLEELDRYKEMFEESSSCQLQLEVQNSELKEIFNALEKENSKLMVKICEGHEIELELCIWKSIAEELEKELMIEELEKDIHNVQDKLLLQENFLSDSKKIALTIEAELEAKHLEMNNLTDQMEARLRTSEALVDNLKSEKTNLLKDNMKLSMDREILFGFFGGLGDGISEFSREDTQLMGFLERIVQSFDNNNPSDFKGSGELFDSRKENKNSILPSPETKMEAKHLEMKNLTDHMEG